MQPLYAAARIFLNTPFARDVRASNSAPEGIRTNCLQMGGETKEQTRRYNLHVRGSSATDPWVKDFVARTRRPAASQVLMKQVSRTLLNTLDASNSGPLGIRTDYPQTGDETKNQIRRPDRWNADHWNEAYLARARHAPTVSALIMSAPRVPITQVSTLVESLVAFQFEILSVTFNYLVAPALLVPG
jgi:hypothetical protein